MLYSLVPSMLYSVVPFLTPNLPNNGGKLEGV